MNKNNNQHPIILTGMHRSGTSLLSKIFQNEGVLLGNQKDINNESVFFQNINKWILSSYGCSWNTIEDLEISIDDKRFDMMLFKMKKLIESRLNYKYFGLCSFILRKSFFNLKDNWGWKDPRSIVTLPFWMNLFPNAKVIVLLRHPFDVVNSLLERNKLFLEADIKNKNKLASYFLIPFLNIENYSNLSSNIKSFNEGMRLYQNYYKIIKNMKSKYPENVLLIKYEDLVSNKKETISKVFKFNNIDLTEKNNLFMETIYSDRMFNFKSIPNKEYDEYKNELINYGYINENS